MHKRDAVCECTLVRSVEVVGREPDLHVPGRAIILRRIDGEVQEGAVRPREGTVGPARPPILGTVCPHPRDALGTLHGR